MSGSREHVLCENFTLSTEQAQELFDLAEERACLLWKLFWIRFLPAYISFRAMLRDGVIGGKPDHFPVGTFCGRRRQERRKFKSELGGGALLDIGIYNLIFPYDHRNSTGRFSKSEVHMTEYGTDDYSEIELEYPGGCSGHCIRLLEAAGS